MKKISLLFAFLVFASGIAFADTYETPSTLGSARVAQFGSSSGNCTSYWCARTNEPTVQDILNAAGYSLSATSGQTNDQVWNTGSSAVTLTVHEVAKYSRDQDVFGYFTNGDLSTFTPLFKTSKISGYENVPLISAGGSVSTQVPAFSSIGFAIFAYWGASNVDRSATQTSLNTFNVAPSPPENAHLFSVNGRQLAVVYQPSSNDFVVGFEDTYGGDYDYNDLVIDANFPAPPAGSTAPTCSASGQYSENGNCVASCAVGYTQENDQCVFSSCPAGYTQSTDQSGNPECSFTGCPANFVQKGNQCVSFSASKCAPHYLCGANGDLYYESASCKQTLSQTCSLGCYGGACLTAPPLGAIIATPSLVKYGETSAISWSASGVQLCSVSGTNGDGSGWNCTGSSCNATSTKTSIPITSQVIYTLSCTALDNSVFSRQASITLVPQFEEQ